MKGVFVTTPFALKASILALLFLVGCGTEMSSSTQTAAVFSTATVQEIESPTVNVPEDTVSGIVVDGQGNPIENATVRLQGTSLYTTTNLEGQFILRGINKVGPFKLTAFSSGYLIKAADVMPGSSGIKIILVAYSVDDHQAYAFLTAGSVIGTEAEGTGCALCHSANLSEATQGITLPFDQWSLDAHAKSAQNPRFLSMYNGTDLQGHQSPLTTYVIQQDYGLVPLRPILDKSFFGPGFKLDFPQKTGNCAACHDPVAAINAPYDTDPNNIKGTGSEGITCDFCHKIWGVVLADATGLPNNNMPGVLSYIFRRPSGGDQLFLGPFDDVAPGQDTFSPLQNQSAICAACHSASFWDTQIYNSYGEWLASPYSDVNSTQYRTCQACHMPSLGIDHFARIEKGGLIRDPDTIFSHQMPGAFDVTLLQKTAELEVTAKKDGGLLTVSVTVFNANAGHDLPTDSPLRQVLLSVKAFDKNNTPLSLISGPVLPDWTGDYKNTPGIYFAKILEQLWTEVSPSASYWMQTRIVEDTRLPALETRKSEFVFKATEDSSVTIDASLIYRRAFYDLMQQKGWNTPDIIMQHKIIELP